MGLRGVRRNRGQEGAHSSESCGRVNQSTTCGADSRAVSPCLCAPVSQRRCYGVPIQGAGLCLGWTSSVLERDSVAMIAQ